MKQTIRTHSERVPHSLTLAKHTAITLFALEIKILIANNDLLEKIPEGARSDARPLISFSRSARVRELTWKSDLSTMPVKNLSTTKSKRHNQF